MGWFDKLKSCFREISLEPVFFLFCLNSGLINIPSQSLYIKKACQVNLRHSEAVCDNIQQHEDVQIETQQYVSQIQAYNGNYSLETLDIVVQIFTKHSPKDTYSLHTYL